MNWNHFLLLLTGLYLGYYSINVLIDLYFAQKSAIVPAEEDILSFSDEIQPRAIGYDDLPAEHHLTVQQEPGKGTDGDEHNAAGAPEATGGVSLKELFRLAQDELIEYTRSIPYSP